MRPIPSIQDNQLNQSYNDEQKNIGLWQKNNVYSAKQLQKCITALSVNHFNIRYRK